MDNTKIKENTFLLIILTGLIFSLFNNFYQIEKFDNFDNSSKITQRHSMITGDIEVFWREGDQIVQEMKNGKSYFESGGEYRRPYLPSRIIGLFSFLSSENLLSEDGKVSLGNKKILLLIIQSLTYYILLFFLYKKILDYLPSLIAKITILFLAFEPTIFMYHSSFWSESIFFSLQLLVILFIFNKNHNITRMFLLGLLLGILYLQRSVAIYYIFPILLFYYFYNKENFFKHSIFISLGLLIVLLFVGFHNYKRSGIFYLVSTQARDGFYIYLIPNILSKKNNITSTEARNQLNKKKEIWKANESINLNKEKDRLKHYEYQQKTAFNVILNNPITSLKVIFNNTLHFFVIDPLTHVYYLHRWNYDHGHYYKSDQHKKWIIPRILYSLLIYFFCFLGIKNAYKEKKYRIFLLYFMLSILYFTFVQSWYGGTRYFAPILIYLSFFFAFGVASTVKKFKLD